DAQGFRPDQTVLVRGERIAEVGPSSGFAVEPGSRIVDLRGRYLIPGLWDMHVHLSALGANRLPIFLVNGVTGVRDLGGIPDSVFRWRAEIAAGSRLGPRIVAAGRSLTGPSSSQTAPHVAVVTTAEEARAAVRANADRGAGMIKVWSTIPRDAYVGALDEAFKHRLPVVGHLPVDVSLSEALDQGQRGIEHTIG